MLERDGYPAGVPCWIDTAQPDPEAAVAFYGDLFGWEFEDTMPVDQPGSYFIGRRRGRDVAAVGSLPEGSPPVPMWNTYIWVDSADDATVRATEAGGQIFSEPFDVSDAGRMAVLADPSGAVFCVWQAKNHKGAQLVNEPGTWNWSDLNTRDADSAKAFYGAVFGWETTAVDFGDAEGTMLRLPGYGDFLESTIDPGIRSRQATAGAPEGFEDAVGWLMKMTTDEYPDDVPSHWAVTFAVDDTDLIAERAAKLGGIISVPPFDAGPTKLAVLSDPQGAMFTISKYEPRA